MRWWAWIHLGSFWKIAHVPRVRLTVTALVLAALAASAASVRADAVWLWSPDDRRAYLIGSSWLR